MKNHKLIILILVLIIAFVVIWIVGNNKASAPSEPTAPDTINIQSN